MTGKARKRKGKYSRNKLTKRVATIRRKKEKRREQWEENKYIVINGEKILKPQHRSK